MCQPSPNSSTIRRPPANSPASASWPVIPAARTCRPAVNVSANLPNGCGAWASCSYQEGTPDMFFYGIHGIEALFTLMGTGCQTVSRVQADDADVLTGVWQGGRVGTYHGIRRHKEEFGAVAFGTKGIVPATKSDR